MNKDYLTNTSMAYRGKIIHEAIWLEKHIDLYIAQYFCGKDNRKVKELHLFFFGENRTTFGGKAEVFKHIAETYDYEWYLAYKPLKGTMYKDLEYIISERNILAHRLLDTSDETLEKHADNVVFKRYNLKYKDEVYTKEKFDELVITIQSLMIYITKKLFLSNVL